MAHIAADAQGAGICNGIAVFVGDGNQQGGVADERIRGGQFQLNIGWGDLLLTAGGGEQKDDEEDRQAVYYPIPRPLPQQAREGEFAENDGFSHGKYGTNCDALWRGSSGQREAVSRSC